jgi:hypothetical protein
VPGARAGESKLLTGTQAGTAVVSAAFGPQTWAILLTANGTVTSSSAIRIEVPRRPLEDICYVCYEVELKNGGRVREIDLESRAKELGLVESSVGERASGPGWPT